MPSTDAELEGKECCVCGSKTVIQVLQGFHRKYGYCKKHSDSTYPQDLRIARQSSAFELIAKEGRIPPPFEAVFIDAGTKEKAERKFREDHSEKEAQIDEIQINKFCAMVIYHDPRIPTV